MAAYLGAINCIDLEQGERIRVEITKENFDKF